MQTPTPKKKVGRPKKVKQPETMPVRGAAKKLPSGLERYTIILPVDTIEAIKNISYWSRAMVKDITATAFAAHIDKFKAEHPEYVQDGKVKARAAGN